MAGGGGEGASLEYTPTWVVAAVCTVIVAISLAAERLLHYAGKYLKMKNQKPLYEALQKVKEELMLLGFISLMMTVFQSSIVRLCVSAETMDHFLPCSLSSKPSGGEKSATPSEDSAHHRHLLAEKAAGGYRAAKHKLLLALGTKLEHIISQLANEVAEKHIAIEGELVVQPYIVPRLVIGVIIQVLSSYITLRFYALVTRMGTHFKKSIFDEHIQAGLVVWAWKVKKNKGLKVAIDGGPSSTEGSIQMARNGPEEAFNTATLLSNIPRSDG